MSMAVVTWQAVQTEPLSTVQHKRKVDQSLRWLACLLVPAVDSSQTFKVSTKIPSAPISIKTSPVKRYLDPFRTQI